MSKVSVIGAGNVGATAAFLAAQKELGDVALVDVVDGLSEGKALDQWEAAPVERFDSLVTGGNDYSLIKDSDVVIVTAGLARKPGMDRLDLLKKNAAIISEVSANIKANAPEAIIVMVTNPLDVMTYLAWQTSGFPCERVVGQAGVLDSARFKAFIAMELEVSVADIQTMVLGGHGDSMVPLIRYTSVSGIPLSELMSQEAIDALVERTRKGGAEIVGLLKTGSAFYAPGASAVAMAESIIRDKKRILPCSCYLTGQYGIDNLYIGVPCKLGSSGVEQIIELELEDSELEALQASAAIYNDNIRQALS
ncbi:malate dehydrogenase [Planctomycetota bacterium]